MEKVSAEQRQSKGPPTRFLAKSRGFGPLVSPRLNARIHGYQQRRKARTKNTASRCCFRKAFMMLSIGWSDFAGWIQRPAPVPRREPQWRRLALKIYR
jgi:hypothetical protein